jgi:ADP-ribose pyrophosphatase YjhB (NUDIX family)
MADENGSGSEESTIPDDTRTFESIHRLDPDAFNHAKSRVDGGYDRAVEAFLTDEQGRVLLVCEDGRWSLPGGEIAEEQSPKATIRDAVEAATGLGMGVGDLLAVNEVTLTDGDREASLSFLIYGGTVGNDPGAFEPGRPSISAVEWHEELPPATIDESVLSTLLEGC